MTPRHHRGVYSSPSLDAKERQNPRKPSRRKSRPHRIGETARARYGTPQHRHCCGKVSSPQLSAAQGRSLSAALERQCNLHTLAADAARHVGHPDKAFEHYEEAVTCAEKLERTRRRKDAEKKKSHTQGKHHRHASTWGAPEARDERPRRSLEQTDPSGSWNVSEPPAKVEREWGAAATMREDPQRGDGHRDGRRGYLDRDVLDNDRREEHANSGSTKSLLTTAGAAPRNPDPRAHPLTLFCRRGAGYDDQIQERLKLIFMKFSGGAPGLSKPGFEDLLEDAGCPGKASQCVAPCTRTAPTAR